MGAINRMRRALDEYVVEGVKTTIPFHKMILFNAYFRKGDYSTSFIPKNILNEDKLIPKEIKERPEDEDHGPQDPLLRGSGLDEPHRQGNGR